MHSSSAHSSAGALCSLSAHSLTLPYVCSLVKCPFLCSPEHEQRIESALKLPRSLPTLKLMEMRAMVEATAGAGTPCHQCDPEKPRQIAVVHCRECGADYCKEHDASVHCAPQLRSHVRISMSAKSALLSESASKRKSQIFSAAGKENRPEVKRVADQAVQIDRQMKAMLEEIPKGQWRLR